MTTVLEILGTSTPVSEILAKKLGYVRAAILCRIFFYEQLDHKVCEASIGTIAKKLGMSAGTVSNNITWLLENKYIKVIGKHRKGGHQPNKYKVAKRFYVEIQHSADESQLSANECQRSADEIKRRDKEEIKEEIPQSTFEVTQLAIKNACKIAIDDSNKGKLYKATREAMNTGKTPQRIIQFGEWFNTIHWPGKYPSISQIATDWPKFEANGSGKKSKHPELKPILNDKGEVVGMQ